MMFINSKTAKKKYLDFHSICVTTSMPAIAKYTFTVWIFYELSIQPILYSISQLFYLLGQTVRNLQLFALYYIFFCEVKTKKLCVSTCMDFIYWKNFFYSVHIQSEWSVFSALQVPRNRFCHQMQKCKHIHYIYIEVATCYQKLIFVFVVDLSKLPHHALNTLSNCVRQFYGKIITGSRAKSFTN